MRVNAPNSCTFQSLGSVNRSGRCLHFHFIRNLDGMSHSRLLCTRSRMNSQVDNSYYISQLHITPEGLIVMTCRQGTGQTSVYIIGCLTPSPKVLGSKPNGHGLQPVSDQNSIL